MSALLFKLTITWVMRKTTMDRPRGIKWPLFSTFEDVNFADDLALVSHTHQHMEEKTTRLGMFAQQVGLKISQKKTEVMMLNVPNSSLVKVNGDLPTTEESAYLGGTVRQRHQESPQQGKERCHKAKQHLEGILVQHHDQARLLEDVLKATSTNCLPSAPRPLEESCKYSGPRPSPTYIFSLTATKTAWAPSCEGDGSEIV